jgi:SpoVK/Ycf46/Vps4 family AAA+-type ATPase
MHAATSAGSPAQDHEPVGSPASLAPPNDGTAPFGVEFPRGSSLPDSVPGNSVSGHSVSGDSVSGDSVSAGAVTDPSGLSERLVRLSRHVEHLVSLRRQSDPNLDDPYRGLYVSDDQATGLARETGVAFAVPRTGSPVGTSSTTTHREGRASILAEAFDFDDLDLDLLTIIIAPDLEPRFEKLYGYLNDDITQRRATLALCLELMGRAFGDSVIRERLGNTGALVRQGIVHIDDPNRPVLTRSLRVDDRCCSFLLGIAPMFDLERLRVDVQVIRHPMVERLSAILQRGVSSVFLRDTNAGFGLALASSAFQHANFNALCIDLRDDDAAHITCDAVRLLQMAKFAQSALVLVIDDDVRDRFPGLVGALVESTWPCVIVGTSPWNATWSSNPVISFDLDRSVGDLAESLWTELVPSLAPEQLASVTQQLRLRPEQVLRSAQLAHHLAHSENRPVAAADIGWAARAQNSARLEKLAKRTAPTVTWDDLVLPEDVRSSLLEIESRYRYREVVYGKWNVAGKNNRRLGVVALFAGSSGVGKTMAAEAMAGALGLEMYQVNLSSVVDKYIGETEKNLERIFSAAEGVNGVLLFDEADALFGKRSEVSDAKDRYANVEVAYLLQRLESYEGIAILATNLRTNIDDAFSRRLDVVVDFPEPDEHHRVRLWQKFLSQGVPLRDDVDLEFLADRFRLSGGNIRNVCVAAAFLAAARGDALSMVDLVRSTAQEYRKLGRLCTPTEFGEWAEFVR